MNLFAHAQTDSSSSYSFRFPSAVFIQLNTEQNRIKALENNKRYKEVEIVKRDAAIISSKMIADFKDNFHYCPVYYYADTNFEQIKAGKLTGFLVKDDGTIVGDYIKDIGQDYLIAYYGYPVYQSNKTKVVEKSYDMDTGRLFIPYGKGLIIHNSHMEQVSYLYKVGYDHFFFSLKKSNRKYIYESKKYDMEYLPFAKHFNDRLIKDDKNHIDISHYRR